MSFSVVIVDDNRSFLQVARTLLERDGVDVVGVASTSSSALEQVRRLRPDTVLVDVHLGAESGLDLVRTLHADEHCRGSSAILMSTHSEVDLAMVVADAPVAGFVTKSELSAATIDEVRRRRTLP
ncbi:response regulator [Nocardioides euryhalodurans]|nr:response regulator [Nocardioides euryhalodurans]